MLGAVLLPWTLHGKRRDDGVGALVCDCPIGEVRGHTIAAEDELRTLPLNNESKREKTRVKNKATGHVANETKQNVQQQQGAARNMCVWL